MDPKKIAGSYFGISTVSTSESTFHLQNGATITLMENSSLVISGNVTLEHQRLNLRISDHCLISNHFSGAIPLRTEDLPLSASESFYTGADCFQKSHQLIEAVANLGQKSKIEKDYASNDPQMTMTMHKMRDDDPQVLQFLVDQNFRISATQNLSDLAIPYEVAICSGQKSQKKLSIKNFIFFSFLLTFFCKFFR